MGGLPIALVTGDFFKDPHNLDLVREAGCLGLFNGVESLSEAQLKRYQKKQNLVVPQLDAIRSTLKAGIAFQYGLMFDPSTQTLEEMNAELNFITGKRTIPLPAFLSRAIPLPGHTVVFTRTLRTTGCCRQLSCATWMGLH